MDNAPTVPSHAPKVLATTLGSVTLEWARAPEPDVTAYTRLPRDDGEHERPSGVRAIQAGRHHGAVPAFRDSTVQPGVHWYAVRVTRRSVVTPDIGISSPASPMSRSGSRSRARPSDPKDPGRATEEVRHPAGSITAVRAARAAVRRRSVARSVPDAPFAYKLPYDTPEEARPTSGPSRTEPTRVRPTRAARSCPSRWACSSCRRRSPSAACRTSAAQHYDRCWKTSRALRSSRVGPAAAVSCPAGRRRCCASSRRRRADVERHIGRRPAGYGGLSGASRSSGRFLASHGFVTRAAFRSRRSCTTRRRSSRTRCGSTPTTTATSSARTGGPTRCGSRSRPSRARTIRPDAVVASATTPRRDVDVPVPLPSLEPWEPAVAVGCLVDEVIVFCVTEQRRPTR